MNNISGEKIREWSAWIILGLIVVIAGMGSAIEAVLCFVLAGILLLLKSDFYCVEKLASLTKERLGCLEQRFSIEQERIDQRFNGLLERFEELKMAVDRSAERVSSTPQLIKPRQRVWLLAAASVVIVANIALFVYVQSELRVLRGVHNEQQPDSHVVEQIAAASQGSRALMIDQIDLLAQRFKQQETGGVLSGDSFAFERASIGTDAELLLGQN